MSLLEFGSNIITNFIINKGIYRLLYFGWKGITRGNISSFKHWLNAKLRRDPDTCIYIFFYQGGEFHIILLLHYSKDPTFKRKGGIIYMGVFPSPLSNDTEDKSSKSHVNENIGQILYVIE